MSKSVLILGNGVIGRCTAYYAARRGFDVTIVDRNPATGSGCSFGNAGMIVPSHFVPLAAPGMVKLGLKWMFDSRSPFYVKPRLDRDLIGWGLKFNRSATKAHVERSAPLLRDLNLLSRAGYEELAAILGDDFFLTKRGLLMLCKTEHALDEESHMAEKANALGVPAEVLDAAGVARVDPAVTADVAGGVYFPKDCHLSPSAFMTSLGREMEKLNVRIIPGTEVTGWRASAGRVDAVQTAAGEITADEFVLAGGSWSATTVGGLKLKLPMQAGKGYSLTVEHPRQLPEICSIFTEARVAVTPMNGTLRFGGTMEISGLSESVSPRRVEGIIQSIPKYYPAFTPEDFAGIQPWVGLRPCSPDGLPYVGRFGKFANLSAATGHSMMGLSLGPVTGKIMADVLEGTTPPVSIGMLSPDRFA
jgi:D-amino-acid dehydrogenase